MEWCRRYPNPKGSYGLSFEQWWRSSNPHPYNSYGNGAAMRVSQIGFYFNSLDKVLEEAKKSAEVTHNHPEGIKGAQAVASSIFLLRTGSGKDDVKSYVEKKFGYEMGRTLVLWIRLDDAYKYLDGNIKKVFKKALRTKFVNRVIESYSCEII